MLGLVLGLGSAMRKFISSPSPNHTLVRQGGWGVGGRFNQQLGSDFDALVFHIIISRGDGINDQFKVFAEGNLIFLVKDLRYVCSLISLPFFRFNSIEFIDSLFSPIAHKFQVFLCLFKVPVTVTWTYTTQLKPILCYCIYLLIGIFELFENKFVNILLNIS